MEVANFGAAMDTLIDQDDWYISTSLYCLHRGVYKGNVGLLLTSIHLILFIV